MEWRAVEDVFGNRFERFIAYTRLGLAVLCLVAIWFDPDQPTPFPAAGYQLLIAYTVYAGLLAGVVHRLLWTPVSLVLVQAVDLLAFAGIVYFTSASGSPFFPLFTYAVMTGAMRWGAVGAIGASLAAFLAIGATVWLGSSTEPIEVDRVIVRLGYVLIAGSVLAFMSVHQQRLRTELMRLAFWPDHDSSRKGSLDATLAHVGGVLDASEVIVAWSNGHSLHGFMACYRAGHTELVDYSSARFSVSADLRGCPFFIPPGAPDKAFWYDSRGILRSRQGVAVEGALVRNSGKGAIAIPIKGVSGSGWLVATGLRAPSLDTLLVGRVLGAQVGTVADRLDMLSRIKEASALEERIRLARNLHDGAIQALAGVALHLEGIGRSLATAVSA